jgi:hypothetical protein
MQRGSSSSSSSSSYNKAKQKEKYSNSVVTKVRCKTHVFRDCWKKISILNFLFFGVKFNKLLSFMWFLSKILESGFSCFGFYTLNELISFIWFCFLVLFCKLFQ